MQALPRFEEGEKAILGALIVDNEAMGKVQGILVPEDFHLTKHREIFEAMMKLAEDNKPIDFVTLTAAMQSTPGFQPENILKLIDDVPSAANISHYVNTIKSYALRREMLVLVNESSEWARDTSREDDVILGELEDRVRTLRKNHSTLAEIEDENVGGTWDVILDKEKRAFAGELKEEKYESGFNLFDASTGGIYPGNLIVLAARSGMGKTSFALDLVWHNAKKGIRTIYYSFEMTREEVVRRLVAKECHVNILHLKNHATDELEQKRIAHKGDGVRNASIYVDERNMTPKEIESQIIRWNGRHPNDQVKMIVVDHLQIMGTRDTTVFQRRDLQIGGYTAQLKDIAKTHNLAVILLSQLNRKADDRGRKDPRPHRSDLKESGAIEENADVVLGIYRKFEDTKADADKNHADAILMKNRDGPTGGMPLYFLPEYAQFLNQEFVDREENLEPVEDDYGQVGGSEAYAPSTEPVVDAEPRLFDEDDEEEGPRRQIITQEGIF